MGGSGEHAERKPPEGGMSSGEGLGRKVSQIRSLGTEVVRGAFADDLLASNGAGKVATEAAGASGGRRRLVLIGAGVAVLAAVGLLLVRLRPRS